MKTVVLYYSKFGHTRRLAEAMGERLAGEGEVHVVDVERAGPSDLKGVLDGVDLVVMGCPTHRMRLPEAVRPAFDGLPRRILRGARVAAFDTSYRMNGFLSHFTAAKTLDQRLRRLGGKRAAAPETFFMVAREGPLEDGELERAAAWAGALLGKG